MGKKKIAVTTLYGNSSEFYSNQIKRVFNDCVEVEKYCFEDGSIKKGINADLVLIPAYYIFEVINKYVGNNSHIIIANRTLSKEGFKKIKELPKGTKAMLVNVSGEMAVETISLIYQLGIKHVELTPVYPGIKEIPKLNIAVTPGESKFIPDFVEKSIDIGDRVLDISTIMDIAVKLDLEYKLNELSTRKYFKEIVPISFGLEKILGKTDTLRGQLESLLPILDEGIIGVNSKGIVNFYNKSAQKIIGCKKEDVIGEYAENLFSKIPFGQALKTSKSVNENLIKINGFNIVVNVVPIINSGILYGAIALVKRFSDTEKRQHKLRAKLIGKGHRAKYDFKDILGESSEINRCKDIAKRMSKSDSSILITGESGTGKELFAHAIHNSSKRKDFQFVALNCAALPESLLESELFGYEEGAFTGAKKGGKLGLFELAHMGTLFLDEIGEMPLNLQARLLRVLQEREVMRIGGDSLINIDVRIIAATNRDLNKLVKEGRFRKDLYFRLNVLPLKIPALRERKEDIILLAKEMKKEFNADFEFTTDAVEVFMNYDWQGNIRELRNYIEYFTNLEEKTIDTKHIPFIFENSNNVVNITDKDKNIIDRLKSDIEIDLSKYIFLLEELKKCYDNKKRIGRRGLEEIAQQKGMFLTQQEIRKILLKLKDFSVVEICTGRGGTRITDFGIKILRYIKTG